MSEQKRNGHEIAKWFITFPRYVDMKDVTVESMQTIIDNIPPYQYVYIVAEEHDEPGTPDAHYHVSIQFKKKITKPKLKKWIDIKFPLHCKSIHYRGTGSFKRALDYCKKESAMCLELGEKNGNTIKNSEPEFTRADALFWLGLTPGEQRWKYRIWGARAGALAIFADTYLNVAAEQQRLEAWKQDLEEECKLIS